MAPIILLLATAAGQQRLCSVTAATQKRCSTESESQKAPTPTAAVGDMQDAFICTGFFEMMLDPESS